jgi:hypothetical protein
MNNIISNMILGFGGICIVVNQLKGIPNRSDCLAGLCVVHRRTFDARQRS